jgi:hypothetical protein
VGNHLPQRKRFTIEIRAPRGIIYRKESALLKRSGLRGESFNAKKARYYRDQSSTGNHLSQRMRSAESGSPKISQRKIMFHERSPPKKKSCLVQKVNLENDVPQKMLHIAIIFNERKAFHYPRDHVQ